MFGVLKVTAESCSDTVPPEDLTLPTHNETQSVEMSNGGGDGAEMLRADKSSDVQQGLACADYSNLDSGVTVDMDTGLHVKLYFLFYANVR